MSKLLLDSHILLWLLYKPANISKNTEQNIQSAEYVGVSVISLWELAIKHKYKKLRFSTEELLKGTGELGVSLLPCQLQHIVAYKEVVLPHKDPFDTMLIAQAKVENLKLLTADEQLINSPYPTISV